MPLQTEKKIILASNSPRRRQLLQDAGYKFQAVCPPLRDPDAAHTPINAAAWAEALAYYKARAVAQLHPNSIVIGADTLCVHGEHILGKPVDREDARRILTHHFAGKPDVITGIALVRLNINKRIITHDVTAILMRAMENDELENYLQSGAWKDKAGAYALQEGGDVFVQSMQGSESNVVGLPMELLSQLLKQFHE